MNYQVPRRSAVTLLNEVLVLCAAARAQAVPWSFVESMVAGVGEVEGDGAPAPARSRRDRFANQEAECFGVLGGAVPCLNGEFCDAVRDDRRRDHPLSASLDQQWRCTGIAFDVLRSAPTEPSLSHSGAESVLAMAFADP